MYPPCIAFSEEIVREAWKRSGERCECRSERHGHEGRCAQLLLWTMSGREGGAAWPVSWRTSWGTNVLGYCEIRCEVPGAEDTAAAANAMEGNK